MVTKYKLKKIKKYPRDLEWGKNLFSWKLLVLAFLLNHFVMNEKLWMKGVVFIGEFPPEVELKYQAFST